MKEKVISILAAHDALRADEKAAFVAYLNEVFTKAEAIAGIASRVAALEAKK